jgi:hypothetical protein
LKQLPTDASRKALHKHFACHFRVSDDLPGVTRVSRVMNRCRNLCWLFLQRHYFSEQNRAIFFQANVFCALVNRDSPITESGILPGCDAHSSDLTWDPVGPKYTGTKARHLLVVMCSAFLNLVRVIAFTRSATVPAHSSPIRIVLESFSRIISCVANFMCVSAHLPGTTGTNQQFSHIHQTAIHHSRYACIACIGVQQIAITV